MNLALVAGAAAVSELGFDLCVPDDRRYYAVVAAWMERRVEAEVAFWNAVSWVGISPEEAERLAWRGGRAVLAREALSRVAEMQVEVDRVVRLLVNAWRGLVAARVARCRERRPRGRTSRLRAIRGPPGGDDPPDEPDLSFSPARPGLLAWSEAA